ncbi:MAG: VWA domain-containing protein [Planctomycetes bacterium]|nr:VWA domain-containing protein [Planctomycetota bacterium]
MSALLRKFAYSVAVALLAGVVVAPVWAQEKPAEKPVAAPVVAEGPAIDLVICLDVSGSMNGLIDSAKIRLWDIVNELAKLKPTPNLRVGLYSYGHSNYPADKGWVRKDMDLTVDLDDVYKALNSLTIGGGTEYVARVSKAAIEEQKWSAEKNAMKLVFVCGNEPADQDKQVTLTDVAALAKKNDILINTIYCKYGRDDEIAGWAGFSEKCGGKHMTIDQNKAVQQVVVKTEFDEQIVKLGEELNKTYVAFGKDGKDRAANQLKQDENAKAAPGVAGAPQVAAIARAESKAGALYRNSTWDLVDKMKEKDFDLKKVKEEDLCDDLKKLKPEERLEYLKKKAEERAELQKKITDLSAKRAKKVEEELAKKPKTDGEKALDEAVKGLIRDQAKTKGFEVPGEKK